MRVWDRNSIQGLVPVDHGRLWWLQWGSGFGSGKIELQELSRELELEITVCHLPPGIG